MSATIAPNGLPQPNLFGGGFGLNLPQAMPQAGGIPNLQAGFAGQQLIMQPKQLEVPGIAQGGPMFGELGGVGANIGQDMDGGMSFGMQQTLPFDTMPANFLFYPEDTEPMAVEQSNDSEQATPEVTVDQSKADEEGPVKTRDATVTRKKQKKSGVCSC